MSNSYRRQYEQKRTHRAAATSKVVPASRQEIHAVPVPVGVMASLVCTERSSSNAKEGRTDRDGIASSTGS
ncbi:hypothetical protein QE152_g15368 [Popillia japonica]|uniref:Uncharacterized protein n=1 Tax=Popillia japonica TaxID=7064 RepID=A0AAW1L8I4_POPJA